MDFQGKVALVTGAGSGIGQATAEALAQSGAKVVATDLDEDAAQAACDALDGSLALPLDVTKPDSVHKAFEEAVEHFGHLDLAVNNAGWEGINAPIAETKEADWDRLMDINLKGVWRCLQEEMPRMKGGSIVNVSSVAGLIGFPGLSDYVASKHGVIGLTRSAALEAAPSGTRVNCVCPGAISTPMLDRALEANPPLKEGMVALHPLGRIGEAHEVANAIRWLLSDEASFVTGAIVPVDGGWTIA